jgi:hypothetical protein
VTPNQSKEIALKWKKDKDNIREASAYIKKLDTDIRKAILKRKAGEQEIKDGHRKNGHGKHGAKETGCQPEDKRKHTRVGLKP